MTHKFRNRYRISSSRAPWWDYGDGSYFVTICTRNRTYFFGEIIDGEMHASQIGDIAKKHWIEIPDRFPFVHLGEFVIMPNHIHGIVNIHGTYNEALDMEKMNMDIPQIDHTNISKSGQGGITGIYNPMLYQNLSRAIRWFTGRVSYEAHKINPDFNWQGRFDDRIIWDSEEFETKTRYIQRNVLNWKEDDLFDK